MSQRFSTSLDEHAFFGIEVAVEFLIGEIVELFEDERLGLGLGELAADAGEKGVGLGDARLQRRLVLLQGGDLLLLVLLALVEGGEPRLDLREEFLALGRELVGAEPLELELELQFVGQSLEFGLALPDALLDGGDGVFLRPAESCSSFCADSPALSFRSSISSLRAFLMTAAVTVSSSSGS